MYKVILKSTVDQFLFSGRKLDRPFYLPYAESGENILEVMILDMRGAYSTSSLKAKVYFPFILVTSITVGWLSRVYVLQFSLSTYKRYWT